MKFKVFIFSVFCLLITNSTMQAQDAEYTDLLVMYVDEDYEKCLKKAEKYMDKDESKNDALPYLYTAMTYFEMSRDSKFSEDFPNAYKNSISYLTKYRKKDKAYAYKSDSQQFIEKVKLVLAEEIDNYILDDNEKSDKKITNLLKKIVRIDPEDGGSEFMLGVYYYKTKNKSEGKKYLASGKKRVLEIGDSIAFGDMTQTQQLFFKESIVAFYKLNVDRFPADAKEILLLGKEYFTEEREDCYIENKADYLKVYKDIEG